MHNDEKIAFLLNSISHTSRSSKRKKFKTAADPNVTIRGASQPLLT